MEEISTEEIESRVFSDKSSLTISRLPKNVKDFIVKYANENCCGDYGWAITDLIGRIPKNVEEIVLALADFDERLGKLENTEIKTEKKEIGRGRFK